MEQHDITRLELLAYLDNALTPDDMARIRRRLDADEAFAAALTQLRAQEADLFALGDDLRHIAPALSIREDVMRQVAAKTDDAPHDEMETELIALGQQLRADTPAVDVTAAVMGRLPQTREQAKTRQLEQELVEVGREIRKHAPQVALRAQVAAEVAAEKSSAISTLEAHNRRKALRRRQSPLSWRAVAAAAACLAVGMVVLMSQMLHPTVTGRFNMARHESRPTSASEDADQTQDVGQREGEPLRFEHATSTEAISLLSNATRPAATSDDVADSDDVQAVSQDLTIEGILAARRDALGGKSEALALLAQWGALDPDEVRRLLAEGKISAAELAGLSRFLPEDEAIALLEQALAQQPDDPALRYALARQLMEDPARHMEALEHLAALKELAPGNSLPYYMDAQLLLAQGDYLGALQLLEYAASFGSGSAFALDAAQYHGAALLAAGLPPDVARMLAAFNAGANEYNAVTQLSHDLLSYGAYFESLGDYETAYAIYKSVHRLGLQVNQGAMFSNEQLAGLDTQMAAIEAINALSQVLNDPAMMHTVDDAYILFLEGLGVFLDNTRLIETLLGNSDVGTILRIVRQIMRAGELGLP